MTPPGRRLVHGWSSWLRGLLVFSLITLPSISQAQTKTFDLAGVPLALEDRTEQVDVYFRSFRLNRALGVWNVEVVLSNKSAQAIEGPVVWMVESYSGTTGPIDPDGLDGFKLAE